ncbi:MAG: AMP-binding protein [Alphaproteobacteria bacterium]
MGQPIYTPLEMFYRWEKETPNTVFLRQPKNLVWTEYTWREVADRVRRVAAFLIEKNFEKGSRIAIWSSNSKDWPIVDLAIQMSGHIGVPLYPGQDVSSAKYILSHSGTKLIFVGAVDQADHVKGVLPPGVDVVGMLGCNGPSTTTLEDILNSYKPFEGSPVPDLDDLLTIVYTSGTTGNPKGVMHTHEGAGFVAQDLIKAFNLGGEAGRLFSFLPMSHIAERVAVEMAAIYSNSSISFSEGLATFADELRSVQPTFFFAVPRLWLKFKEGVDAKIPPAHQANLSPEQRQGIIHQLGLGAAKLVLTGSAPLAPDVQDWYLGMGIALRDAYGVTENFIHGTGWLKDDKPISGCVGQPLSSRVEVRIGDGDEIQFKSKGVMKGYYLEPEKTAEAFDGEWYRTGDAGRFDDDGNLWITGRISETFKTSKGKFIVPTRLENMFGSNNKLGQLCVFGLGKTQPMMLATLSESAEARDRAALILELTEWLGSINAELPAYERVSNLFVTPNWTIENGLLTPTLKIKRRQIEAAYGEKIEKCDLGAPVIFLQ